MKDSRRFDIIGGGISGLTLGYYLSKKNVKIRIYEKNMWGGLIQTKIYPDMLVESAANAFLATEEIESIAREIACDLVSVKKAGRSRYIFLDGKFRKLPLSFKSVFKLLFVLFKFLIKREQIRPRDGETVSAWSQRIFNHEIYLNLISTALQGIYAGDPEKLSASLIFSPLFSARLKKGKLKGSLAPSHGMGFFIEKLIVYLKRQGVEFISSEYPIELLRSNIFSNQTQQDTDGQLSYETATMVYAGSPWDFAQFLNINKVHSSHLTSQISEKNQYSKGTLNPKTESHPQNAQFFVLQKINQLFSNIDTFPLLRVTVSFKNPIRRINGFGVLFPRSSGIISLGVLSNSDMFDNRGSLYNETWIMGGAPHPELIHLSDTEIQKIIMDDRRKSFLVDDSIHSLHVVRWEKSIPHYTVELESVLNELHNLKGPIYFTGNYLGNLGLSRIIEYNRNLADKMTS